MSKDTKVIVTLVLLAAGVLLAAVVALNLHSLNIIQAEAGKQVVQRPERPPAIPWAKWKDDNAGDVFVQDTSSFDVNVTARTVEGRGVTVSGQYMSTKGEQWWMQRHPRVDRRPEFWVREQLGSPDIQALLEDEAWLERTPLTELPSISFEVNGTVIGMAPFSPHEGLLERIHVDVADGSSGEEVTVIGYYSQSTADVAMEKPRTRCIWCGEIEVCTVRPTCDP